MRTRPWPFIVLALLLIALTACSGVRVSRAPTGTPTPIKTQRPTFTHTPEKPTLMPTATPIPATPTPEIPTATPEPPTPEPTPTPDQATFTVASTTVNVRSGPGTNFGAIGQLRQGQTATITGKNPTGDWWQFDFNGRQGWVFGQNVRVVNAGVVQVATNIPAAPTARPAPTRAPQRPATARPPTQAPAPPPAASLFVQAGTEYRNADDTNFGVVTFWGRLGKQGETTGSGYRLRVTAPSGTDEKPFEATWQWAYPGQSSQFIYNVKLELPRAAGAFRAVVIDGGGKEVSDAITGSLLDRTHDVLLNWGKR